MAPAGRSQRRGSSRLLALALASCLVFQYISWTFPNASKAVVISAAAESTTDEGTQGGEPGFFSKVLGAAAQGATAAFVAAILSACTEPIVNRLLVKRMTFEAAMKEVTFKLISNFFLTTFPTNMLKFPAFEVISILMTFTNLAGWMRGMVSGFLFCTMMLPVTNYRFRKSMQLPITPSNLYQAYVPTVSRDIVYGWARGFFGGWLARTFPSTPPVALFGMTIFIACIVSSPGNEWRGYTLQPPDKKKPFNEFFKPENYARSTGVGATIMGIALSTGMLITPYVEQLVSAIGALF